MALVDEGHDIGHTAVVDETNVEPRCDLDAVVQTHIGLDQDLDNLINHQYGNDNTNGHQAFVSAIIH